MNKILFIFGMLLVFISIGLGLLEDLFLSYLGVPSVSDIGKSIVQDIPSNESIKQTSYEALSLVKFIENIPSVLFIAGLVLGIISFFLKPNEN